MCARAHAPPSAADKGSGGALRGARPEHVHHGPPLPRAPRLQYSDICPCSAPNVVAKLLPATEARALVNKTKHRLFAGHRVADIYLRSHGLRRIAHERPFTVKLVACPEPTDFWLWLTHT